MAALDPLGLERCQSCGNAFAYDEQADGTCGHCGGPFRRQGRPVVGGPSVKLAIPNDLLADVDAFASREGVSRAEAVRTLTRAGLIAHRFGDDR